MLWICKLKNYILFNRFFSLSHFISLTLSPSLTHCVWLYFFSLLSSPFFLLHQSHSISSHSTNLASPSVPLWISLLFVLYGCGCHLGRAAGVWIGRLGLIMGIFGDRRSSSNYSDDDALGGVFIRIRFYCNKMSGIALWTRALEVFLLAVTTSMIEV